LIRPALAWREGVGQKPPGAFDGRGFVVTQAMTSLTGSSGEDFASVLRALGYRLDRRPKPVEAASETKPGPEPDKPADASETIGATELGATEQNPPSEATSSLPAATQDPTDASVDQQPGPADVALAPVTPAEGEPPSRRSQTEIAPHGSETEAATASADASASAVTANGPAGPSPAPAASSSAEAPSEQQFIDVWRPGRSDERRPRRHHRPAREKKPSDAPAAAAAAEQAAPAPDPGTPVRREEPRRHRDDGRKEREASDRPGGRDGRRPERRERADRHDRPDRQERRRDRRDDDRPPRTWEAGRERRGKEPDPDSPFAKLAALKAQLEADAKDRR
jgi:ATP-dependent RNA helicase SUPV3L1/SUV3